MKRKMLYTIFIIMSAWVLSFPAQAQTSLFLPLILKGGSMAVDPVLRVTDGTIIIDLLGYDSGWELADPYWTPKITQYKGGGVFQDSSLASGRRLVQKVYQNVVETIPLSVRGSNQVQAINTIRELLQLSEQAGDFWAEDYEFNNVWIEASPACNDALTGYAQIISMRIPELSNPYGQPFFSAGSFAAMEDITLVIEREPFWHANSPGGSECVQLSNDTPWDFQAQWAVLDNMGGDSANGSIKTSDGTLLVGRNNNPPQVERSTDDGDTWSTVSITGATGTDAPIAFALLANGDVLLSFLDEGTNPGVWRSSDNGATWSKISTQAAIRTFLVTSNGSLYAGTEAGTGAPANKDIIRSGDGGVTWSNVFDTGRVDGVSALVETSNGYLFAANGDTDGAGQLQGTIWRSIDNGSTWTPVLVVPTSDVGGFRHMIVAGSDRLIALDSDAKLWATDDYGVTWSVLVDLESRISSTSRPGRKSLLYDSNNIIWAFASTTSGAQTYVFFSTDNGLTWALETVIAINSGNIWTTPLETDDNQIIFAGLDGSADWVIMGRTPPETVSMGRTATCDNELRIVNKSNLAQVTNIVVEDNGSASFTEVFPMSSFPVSLFPATPATNDALYIGIATTQINNGPFTAITFDLSQPIQQATGTDYVLAWEYWDGSAWSSLTVQDNTQQFLQIGVQSVHFRQPSNWAATTVNGISALWVRARITTTGSPTFTDPPKQQSRNIYVGISPYVEIAAAQVGGDVPAIIRLKAKNESDKDSVGGSGPDLYAQRMVIGLRSYERGAAFTAYLNASDTQKIPGITTSVGANTAFRDNKIVPTGRQARYTTGASDPMANRFTWTLDASTAASFYGTFHAYLRGKLTGGVNESYFQLQVETGSGGIIYTTEQEQFQTAFDWEIVDFGQIKIPVGSLSQDDIPDTMEIRIQSNSIASSILYDFYDLVLMPADEWVVDAIDQSLTASSAIGRVGDQRLLDVDSISTPIRQIRTLVRDSSDRVVSIYVPASRGAAILLENTRQRLWFFAMQKSDTVPWLAYPEISHSVQVFKNQRYLALRGDS